MAVYPEECIWIEGRDLFPEDLIPLSSADSCASYESLSTLLDKRRSVRNYQDRPVSQEALDKIIQAVSIAPMGLPPNDVEVLVFTSRDALAAFTEDIIC